MNKRNLIFIFVFLLVGILLISFASATYRSSNPKYFYGGIQSAFGSNPAADFDPKMCQEGQDFIVQIDPTGCTPAVVRSDLLEEQDVPVFCPLKAIKINPLMNVDAIHSMTFGGQVPPEVRSVGFHPAKSALSSNDNLVENPMYDNIGYAVVILKNQPNESAMPEFVEGNLTARIRYDVENAFGIRRNTFYLPIMSEQDWQDNMVRYSFWDGRGYLRAEDVQGDSATVAIYSDVYRTSFEGNTDSKRKFGTVNLQKGKTSDLMFLPGFYCFAGLKLRLDNIEYADTRALLRINSEYLEIKEGEKFLDDKCYIKQASIEESGINKQLKIYCREDEGGFWGGDVFGLNIAPIVQVKVDNIIMNVSIGDALYSNDDSEMVYLGYAKMREGGNKKENLRIYLLSKPCNARGGTCPKTLDNDEITAEAELAEYYEYEGLGEGSIWEFYGELFAGAYGRIAKTVEWIYTGDRHWVVDYNEKTEFKDSKITLLGFSEGFDLDVEEQALDYYELAKESYNTVSGNFQGFAYPDNKSITLDEQALISDIKISSYLSQGTEVKKLCLEFSNRFQKSKLPIECKKIQGLAETGSKIENVLINGEVKEISLVDVYEMNYEDYGVELFVRGPDGSSKTFYLEKDRVLYLNSISGSSSETFIVPQKISSTSKYFKAVYFQYYSKEKTWKWSVDMQNWMTTKETVVTNSVRPEYRGTSPEEEIIDLIIKLENKDGERLDYYEGKTIFPANTRENKGDFVKLTNIKSYEEAQLQIHAPKAFLETTEDIFLNDKRTLMKNSPQTFDTKYTFMIKKINLREYARVSVIPEINYQKTDADFKFKIFIEKRAIQLSPEKIESKVAKLNKTIEDWTKISDGLGDVVKTMKTACVGVSAVLTVKNLLENSDGKSMARTEVMKGDNGWTEFCVREVNKKDSEFHTVDECYLRNAKEIEEEVDLLHNKLKTQNNHIEELQKNCLKNNKFLESKTVDTGCLAGDFSEELLEKLEKEEILTNPSNENEDLNLANVKKTLNKEGWESNTYSVDQLKDIDLNYDLWKNAKSNKDKAKTEEEKQKYEKDEEKYKQKLYNGLYQIDKNSKEIARVAESRERAKKYGLDVSFIPVGGEKKETGIYEGGTLTKTSGNDGEAKSGDSFQGIYHEGESYFVILEDLNGGRYGVDKVYDIDWNRVEKTEEDSIISLFDHFEKYDKTTYQNKNIKPELTYYDSEPYAGQPALIPVDNANGWYVYIRQTLGAAGNIGSYDLSGIPNSFVLANVGPNGIAEYPNSNIDDIWEVINTKTGQAYNQFPGLDKKESAEIISKAIKAIKQAQYIKNKKIGGNHYILGQKVEIGSPAANIPLTQCADFMSVKDCQTLFNVCDPVVCPSSRCDLGGRYPVKDVIQSGIIGSIALCLPNFNEGVYIPVCLSGIKAGMDGWISVSRAYKDCLQENLDTGETVGICDEMNSIYMCDFFWRQALPITKILFPKLLEIITGESTVRGGGEYMFVDSALDTAQNSINFLTQNYALNTYNAFKFRNTEQIGSAVCKNFISLTYPGGVDFLDTLTDPDSPSQFTGKFDEIPFSTATNPAISHYKVYYHIYAGNDRGAYFRVYLRGGGENLFYEDDFLGRIVESGYIAKGEYGSETVDFTAPSGMKELCINVNGQEECGFGQVTTNFAIDWMKDQYISRQAEERSITTEKACISGTADWYSMLNPNVQEGVGDLIDPQIYNKGLIRICASENPGLGSDKVYGTEKQRWIDMGYCGDKQTRCWLDQESVKDAVEFSYTADQILEETGNKLIEDLLNSTNYLKEGEFASKLKEIEKEKDFQKKLKLINAIFDRVFYMNQKGHLHFLTGEIYSSLARKASDKKSSAKVGKDSCEDLARLNLLEALDLLEGTSATREDDNPADGGVVKDCDANNVVNCYDVARYAYDKENLILECVYSDKDDKKYTVEDGTHKIATSTSGSDSFVVNPSRCANSYTDEDDKLDLLQPGDLISYYWGKSLSHNSIFIEWVDVAARKAKMFDGNLGSEDSERFRFYEISLKDSEHPVFMFWKPVLSTPEDIEGCGCAISNSKTGFCTSINNPQCIEGGFVEDKCPGDKNIQCCMGTKEEQDNQEIDEVLGDIEEAISEEDSPDIFNLQGNPEFKLVDHSGITQIKDTCFIFKNEKWYWTKNCGEIGERGEGFSIPYDWISSTTVVNQFGLTLKDKDKELIIKLRGQSLKQGFEVLLKELTLNERDSIWGSPSLETESTTYKNKIFEVDLIDRPLYFEHVSTSATNLGWYVSLDKDMKNSIEILTMSDAQLKDFFNFEKAIFTAIKDKNFENGAYVLFLISLSDFGSEGVIVEDPFSGKKTTCWELGEAMVYSKELDGKYKKNMDNKIFIDQLCADVCRDGDKNFITEEDCEDIRGTGEDFGWAFWEWRGWNAEETMDYVKNLLIKERSIQTGKKWDALSAYLKVDFFEEGGWLDKAFTEDGKTFYYSDWIYEVYREGDNLIDDKDYNSFKNNKADNLIPDLENHFKSKIDFNALGVSVTSTPISSLSLSCSSTKECQQVLGAQLMNVAKSYGQTKSDIRDSDIKEDLKIESFECLVALISLQESSIRHCKKFEVGGNPLYCDENDVLVSAGGDIGIMQISPGSAGGINSKDLEQNIMRGLELLYDKYDESSTKYPNGRKYLCNGKTYSGWKLALRYYNGFSSKCYDDNGNPNGDLNYVEHILNKRSEFKKLFPECV